MRHPDRDAEFSAFVLMHGVSLQRFAFLVCGNRNSAEDLVQTGLLQLLGSWSRVRDPDARNAYVRRTIINHQRSLWRRRASTDVLTDTVPESAVLDPYTASDRRQDLNEVLQRLPVRQRAVVILRFYEDMSEAQVAELLGCSIGTVKSQTSRALAKLRTHLDDPTGGVSRVQ